MKCQCCGKSPLPPRRYKYCSKRCCYRGHYQEHWALHQEQARAWTKAHPRKRRAIQNAYYARNAAKIIAKRSADKEALADMTGRNLSRIALLKQGPPKCRFRGKHRGRVECHHLDGNPRNRALPNLVWSCKRHHEVLHHQTEHSIFQH